MGVAIVHWQRKYLPFGCERVVADAAPPASASVVPESARPASVSSAQEAMANAASTAKADRRPARGSLARWTVGTSLRQKVPSSALASAGDTRRVASEAGASSVRSVRLLPYLLDKPFKFDLHTDTVSLQWLQQQRPVSHHLARWLNLLTEYQYRVIRAVPIRLTSSSGSAAKMARARRRTRATTSRIRRFT